MPRGRPHASWLRQGKSNLKDTGIAGLASAWAMATDAYLKEMSMTGLASVGRRPDGGRRSIVARWTRRRAVPAYAPTPDLTRSFNNNYATPDKMKT